MKLLITLVVLLTFNIPGHASLEDFSIDIEEARRILGEGLGDEVFLKERLRLENAQKKFGEVISHKVGNGFQILEPNPTIEEYINCKINGSEFLRFIILRTSNNGLVAVLTDDPTAPNLAEFLDVQLLETYPMLRRQLNYTGQNLTKGEMFQLELKKDQSDFLRIVRGQKLYLLKVSCNKKE